MWKLINQRAKGTTHERQGIACQDFALASQCLHRGEHILIAACSDGAGSAKYSHLGSRIACNAVVGEAKRFFDGGGRTRNLNEDTPLNWYAAARMEVLRAAQRRQIEARQFAATLLLSVVSESVALFAQIGDGAIVLRQGEEYVPVFWPDSGEYHNSTYFITDNAFSSHVRSRLVDTRVDELAMLTDGLQMLALDYRTKTAHSPFFAPMFNVLRDTPDHSDLAQPLKAFLESPNVNDRTDDDKTLLLAVRARDAKSHV